MARLLVLVRDHPDKLSSQGQDLAADALITMILDCYTAGLDVADLDRAIVRAVAEASEAADDAGDRIGPP